jgi:hypothetical protein
MAEQKFRDLLTIHSPLDPSRGVYEISVFCPRTKELLGTNTLRLEPIFFDSFAIHAEAAYLETCPFMLHVGAEQAPLTIIDTYDLTLQELVFLENKIKGWYDAPSRLSFKERFRGRLIGSAPDSLHYWIALQADYFNHMFMCEHIPQVLLDIETAKKTGTFNMPACLIHKFLSEMSSGNSIKDRAYALNYMLKDALSTEYTSLKYTLRYANIGQSSTNLYTSAIKISVTNNNTTALPEVLSEGQLLPRLSDRIKLLGDYSIPLYGNQNIFSKVPHELIFKYLSDCKINRSSFNSLFKCFNEIKNMYMFIGKEEEEATHKALALCPRLSKDKRCQTFERCLVTGQYLPLLFLTPFENGYISTIYAYIHSATATASGAGLYCPDETGKCMEAPLSGDYYYNICVYGHDRNVLNNLSIRKQPKENTTITDKHSLFKPTPFMGIELEVEQQDKILYPMRNKKEAFAPSDITKQVYDALGRDYVILKRDGSLRGFQPFEIVTVPATLAYHKEKWKSFLDNQELKKYLTSYSSGNCGMHVHISRNSFTGLHLAKFMKFINSQENSEFVTSVAQRANNKFAKYLTNLKSTGGFAKYFRGDPSTGSKYMSVNTKPTDTIEVRIFRGNLAKVGFLKNLEFVHAVWAFTKDAPLTALTFKEFMFWLFNPKNQTKEYKELKIWVLASGWNIDGVVIRKTDTGLVRKQKEERRIQITNVRKLINKKFHVENMPIDVKAKIPQELRLTKEEITSAA